MQKQECTYCADYKRQGHNYCRICGYHLSKGYCNNVKVAVAYNDSEKYCGYCGGFKYECSCR